MKRGKKKFKFRKPVILTEEEYKKVCSRFVR